jgi:hypothetical protein
MLSQTDLLDRIKNVVPQQGDKHPPFTLILGSGFSYGVIPTTSQIVEKDLSWWKWCQRRESEGPNPSDFLDRKESDPRFITKAEAKAREFWNRVHVAQPGAYAERFELNTDSGLPTKDTIGQAYRFALSSVCTPGLNTPNDVRRYFGDIIKRAGNRLNPAHLYLASIIADKKTRRLFGTIFTTNFDPLLQRSLQLVNAPYFVSDRPETLQYPDDDDIADAVHLIYAHGSIYRYLLLNSPAEIKKFATANQPKLQEYFRKHAVLIVGFSGWDDAITRALSTIDLFDHNLYWCDRNPDPDQSSLSPTARKILKKHNNAFYVPILSADDLMVQLHRHITDHTLPHIFREPIISARDQLDLCDLKGMKLPRSADSAYVTSGVGNTIVTAGSDEELDLGNEVATVRKRLDAAQDLYTGKTSTDPEAVFLALVRQRFAVASDLYFSRKYIEALPGLDFVVANEAQLDPAERAQARFRRGYVYDQRKRPGDVDLALADYTAVIDMPDATSEQRAHARFRRGFVYDQRKRPGDVDLELADYTAVIDMPDATAEQHARARLYRGFTYGKREQSGDLECAIADYAAVIEMPDSTAKHRAMALVNRGTTYLLRGQSGDVELAIANLTDVINTSDATAELRACAHITRGMAYGRRGGAGDVELKIADYNAVIGMFDAPTDIQAEAKSFLDMLSAPKESSPKKSSRKKKKQEG